MEAKENENRSPKSGTGRKRVILISELTSLTVPEIEELDKKRSA